MKSTFLTMELLIRSLVLSLKTFLIVTNRTVLSAATEGGRSALG
jgi:hypothetical protein